MSLNHFLLIFHLLILLCIVTWSLIVNCESQYLYNELGKNPNILGINHRIRTEKSLTALKKTVGRYLEMKGKKEIDVCMSYFSSVRHLGRKEKKKKKYSDSHYNISRWFGSFSIYLRRKCFLLLIFKDELRLVSIASIIARNKRD